MAHPYYIIAVSVCMCVCVYMRFFHDPALDYQRKQNDFCAVVNNNRLYSYGKSNSVLTPSQK